MSTRPHYPFVWLGLPLALIMLFSFGPLVALLLGGAVAGALGCNMPIAATAPCLFMGADLSDALAIAVFFGYLAFWTVADGDDLARNLANRRHHRHAGLVAAPAPRGIVGFDEGAIRRR